MELEPKQSQALDILEDKVTTEIVFGGGAGGGKSIIGCYWIAKMCLKYPGTRWVIGRTILKTLKETTLNTMWWVMDQQGIKKGIHYRYAETKGLIVFFNKSEILLKDLDQAGDENFDELGSLEITGAFVDECNQIVKKAWDILKSRIRYKLDENGLIPKILGTCNPSKGYVYTEFYSLWKKEQLPKHKKFIPALIGDNSKISRHYRDNLLTLDKASKERLLYGNWNYSDDPTDLCDFDSIDDCFTNTGETGQKKISADLAMQGRDRFIAGYWEGLIVKISLDQQKSTGKTIETDLAELMRTENVGRSQTVVDSDGLGAYLVSYLTGIKEFHGNARAFNHKEYANLKSECGYKLAEMVVKRKLKIICSSEQRVKITEELSVLKADSVDKDETRKRIINKEKMKELLGHSPDYLDMLLMGMYFEVRTDIFGYSV